VAWVVGWVLLRFALVTFTLAVAVLLTALLSPLATRLRRTGFPAVVAALVSLVLVVAVPAAVGLLVWSRISDQTDNLVSAITTGIDRIRTWLTTGPLSLDPSRIDGLRDKLVAYVERAAPSPMAGASTALYVLTGLLLALFAAFFFLKDGTQMWQWVLDRTPASHRARVDGAGRAAWTTITGFVVGMTAVALADAVLIGAGLIAVGVPLWLSLSLLVFLGAFVPILGATVSGTVAVLVTLVTNNPRDALIVLVVVLVVQQIEGNLLQPLIMRRAIHLHPVVTVVAVTCGSLALGIPGALLAVPVVAVSYRIAEYLRTGDGAQMASR